MPIPAMSMAGVLPPVRPGVPGHNSDRSPYQASLTEVVQRFATSQERIDILNGLLKYRAQLHGFGVVAGFQWLDGSFMEDIEALESRPPGDMDVVTYFYLPAGETQASLNAKAGNLFDQAHVKATYLLDAYQQPLGVETTPSRVRMITYWYSMWSHRRNGVWKGFVQVNLDPKEDIDALPHLTLAVGGTP